MALTRNFKQTVIERVERDPKFTKALLDEAATLFLSGEPETARLILRELVNATIGFEQLAAITEKPSKSLHRMLSPRGNPSMDNLAAIFGAVRHWLKVAFDVHTIKTAQPQLRLSSGFQKKSKRGIAPPKEDIAVIRARLKVAEALAKDLRNEKTSH
jgi:DNA-binding phage protein